MAEFQKPPQHTQSRQSEPILQTRIPFDVGPRALPGIQPLGPDDWITVDEAFAQQTEYRARLIETQRDAVIALDASAQPAADELLKITLNLLRRHPEHGYTIHTDTALLPSGREVSINPEDPLASLGHLVQEDLCILQKQGEEHVLTGAVLCFPASWRLDEKFMRPLTDIHVPVAAYDDQIARRVQRLFDGVQPGKPLWRKNQLWYTDAELHQPRSIHAPRREPAGSAPYLRVERQALLRLPKTGAVVFAIHTYVVIGQATEI